MSKYTTEVRFICESAAGLQESVGYENVNDIITRAAPQIFSFDWPIFDEKYRLPLERKILKHYYTREIGLETYGLWKLKLDTKMNEIMPYFNQRYRSETLEFNPFYDFDVTRDHTNTRAETSNAETNESSNGMNTGSGNSSENTDSNGSNSRDSKRVNMFSDTPQGSLDNVESGTYLTNATVENNHLSEENTNKAETDRNYETRNNTVTEANSETNSKVNSTEDFVEHVKGKQGSASYSKMLEEYRKTMLNIDMEVIEALSELFMNLW